FAEVVRRASEDQLMNLLAPVIEGAAAELPAAIATLQAELGIGDGPLALAGGSAGGAALLLNLCQGSLPLAAAVLINPATRAEAVVEAGERRFGMTYDWNDRNRAKARELDFVNRATEIGRRRPQTPLLFVI